MPRSWLEQAIRDYGVHCRRQLSGGSEPEAAIRGPIERLLETAAAGFAVDVRLHPEVARRDLGVRPDYAIRVAGEVTGYIEVKRREKGIGPGELRGRDRDQWELMRQLPNVLYTNGSSWALYQKGELAGEVVHFAGDLSRAGGELKAPGGGESFALLLKDFFVWRPNPIVSVRQLVRSIAPLCLLLREQVAEQIEFERCTSPDDFSGRRFTALADDWQAALFPRLETGAFADSYAQAVTFALLVARDEGVDVATLTLHEIGRHLRVTHTLLAQALHLLTNDVSEHFASCLDWLRRTVGAVDWEPIREREPHALALLYEDFLEEYDSKLRRQSGTYYTPVPVVNEMVRLTDDVLQSRLGCSHGFADPAVTVVDPAMGTGTFLSSVIDLVADRAAEEVGPGARGDAVEALAERLVGFEQLMGPYAVAQMRVAQTLRRHGANLPLVATRLLVTNTLDDPWAREARLGLGAAYEALTASHKTANSIKRDRRVTVVIGNPPHLERAHGAGGWIENGSSADPVPKLDGFRLPGNGRYEYKLKNLSTYFWRWATYKVFEQHSDDQQGVVCFLTNAGFLLGAGFRGMRAYLREWCSEGWIIDVSPEGQLPPVSTRLFPGVKQTMAIAIFVRRPGTTSQQPAELRHIAVSGSRESKYEQLRQLTLDAPGWRPVRSDATAPFSPAPSTDQGTDWDDTPALTDLFPWTSPGVIPNRTWVYAPSRQLLRRRWQRLTSTSPNAPQAELLKSTRDRSVGGRPAALPRQQVPVIPLSGEHGPCPEPQRVAYRSFDRQFVIPDSRVIDFPRPSLWRAIRDDQIFITEQHNHAIGTGPGVMFSALLPDAHHFNGRGGRVLPIRHADGLANTPPGLLEHLSNALGGLRVEVDDLAAYIAAVVAHPGYSRRFASELNTPGVRVPLTADRALWTEAVSIGRRVIWAHTFGQRFADDDMCALSLTFRDDPTRAVKYLVRMSLPLPTSMSYDAQTQRLLVGEGQFGPVPPEVWGYDVGGRSVLKQWFGCRSANPRGRVGSPLDKIRCEKWESEWSTELMEITSVLRHLTEWEFAQARLLERILAEPVIRRTELIRRRVLPVDPSLTKPRPALIDTLLPGTEDYAGLPRVPVQPLRPELESLRPAPTAPTSRRRAPRRNSQS